jgi:hypothetical protein
VELIEAIPEAHAALRSARNDEADRIAAAIESNQVVGVLGEAEVGKTETVSQALTGLRDSSLLIRIDMDGVASEAHLAFQLAKGVARAKLGEADLSLLSAGAFVPMPVERVRIELTELLGIEGVEEALRRWPSGELPFSRAFESLDALVSEHSTIVWLDHLETPLLTPRHPVDLDRLLWGFRDLQQRRPDLRLVLTARAGAQRRVVGAKAAFHQQGMWFPFDNPRERVWRRVAEEMGASGAVAEHLTEMTGGHPATMLLGLIQLRLEPRVRSGYDVLRELAARDDGLVARAVQHARSLHRLGSQILTQIACGERPYAEAQRGGAAPQEIRKVLDRLRLAGLLRPGDRWTLVNPLLEIRLRGSVRLVAEDRSAG